MIGADQQAPGPDHLGNGGGDVEPKRVLVVANQTSAGPALRAEILRREREGPHRYTLIVPATPPQDHMVWTDDEAFDVASKRLEHALAVFREDDVEITG